MRHQPHQSYGDLSGAGTPASVEVAFRRVRLLTGALVLARLWSTGSIPHILALLLVAGFWSVNLVGYVAEHQDARNRTRLGIVQLLADTAVVILVAWAQHAHAGAESADWAVLVLPAIEGAIRFRFAGALASWFVLAGGYWGANVASTPSLPAATVAQRLTIVLLVALPVGYLADELVAEIEAHRRGHHEAEQRSVLLRAAAHGGRMTSQLDVDEILGVISTTVTEIGFADPQVFELSGADASPATALPVRGSRSEPAIPPGDERLVAAATLRATGKPVVSSTLLALSIPMIDEQFVVLTARWDETEEHTDPTETPSARVEILELFAAQAGASLHNAQVHRGLEELKDRLDHEASHDPLTALANRRLFTDELERATGRGRPGDLVGVLFVDLDGFKEVNDKYGHDTGNDLLVAVASRLRDCVRPGDLVARIGGDEFTIMLTRLESVAPTATIAQRICDAISEPFELGARTVHISASVGIALAPARSTESGDLLRRADAAMYLAKSHGKARWMMDPGSLESAGDTGSET